MFETLQQAVQRQFKKMLGQGPLFTTTTDGQALWDLYLQSFPPGSNPFYKKRTEYDCSCCRHFIKALGGVVTIVDGQVTTLWDCEVGGVYQVVMDTLAAFVRTHAIENFYGRPEKLVGTVKNFQLTDTEGVITWNHYYVNMPANWRGLNDTELGQLRATHDVMLRGLREITPDAIDTVLELIQQGSLYRGEEHKFVVQKFRELKESFINLPQTGDLFVWEHQKALPDSVSRIRNTVIGTLLTDLSEGKDLEVAVRAYEQKVAPTNYKRPKALVTAGMIAAARKTVEELGLTSALERRYATLEDLTINNVLYADRTAKKSLDVFESLAAAASKDPKKLGRVEEISVEDFLGKVLPTATKAEVFFDNAHAGNLVSLVAPVDPTAQQLFKWANGFSWSYTGDVADSIKEKVKAAGGNVTGDFRVSLAWSNYDDLDLHLMEPNQRGKPRWPTGEHIYYAHRQNYNTGGFLDVDMNAGQGTSRTPVENITYPDKKKMIEGEYTLYVNQYQKRETNNQGFEVEMEFGGQIWKFAQEKSPDTSNNIVVAKFTYSHKEGIQLIESLPTTTASKIVWGLPTQTFHTLRVASLSPNHWDEQGVGNRHYFFFLEGCKNDGTARGFYNEFLHNDLTPHRKVLEMVGAKMRTDKSDQQLSGLGFSSTQRNELLIRVTGAFTRNLKVLF